MPKASRPVMFDEKVREPRKRVPHNQGYHDPPPATRRYGSAQQDPSDERSRAMNDLRGRFAVRAHIFRPEFRERHLRPLA